MFHKPQYLVGSNFVVNFLDSNFSCTHISTLDNENRLCMKLLAS